MGKTGSAHPWMAGVLALESVMMPTEGVLAELALCGVEASCRSCRRQEWRLVSPHVIGQLAARWCERAECGLAAQPDRARGRVLCC